MVVTYFQPPKCLGIAADKKRYGLPPSGSPFDTLPDHLDPGEQSMFAPHKLNTPTLYGGCLGLVSDEGRDKLR